VAEVTFTFRPVVAEPALPVRAPENVVAVIVPDDGLTLTVDTVDVAAPDTVVVAGVNIIGWLALVDASVTSTFLPVVAVPVTFSQKRNKTQNPFYLIFQNYFSGVLMYY
jgi:hypothetical protein